MARGDNRNIDLRTKMHLCCDKLIREKEVEGNVAKRFFGFVMHHIENDGMEDVLEREKMFYEREFYETISFEKILNRVNQIYKVVAGDKLGTLTNGHLQGKYINDSIDSDNIDMIGIEEEVRTIASFLASNKLQPPLALGIFGEWGSGKSFYMNLINKHIEEISQNQKSEECDKDSYLENVVHVKFNAWHYEEDNIWASFAAEIFTSIHKKLWELQEKSSGTNMFLDDISEKYGFKKELEDTLEKRKELNKSITELQKQIKADKDKLLEFIKGANDDISEVIKLSGSVNEEIDLQNLSRLHEKIKGIPFRKKMKWDCINTMFIAMGLIVTLVSVPFSSKIVDILQIFNLNINIKVLVGFITGLITLLRIIKMPIKLFFWGRKIRNLKEKKSEVDKINQKLNNPSIKDKMDAFISYINRNNKYKSELGIISALKEDLDKLQWLLKSNKKDNISEEQTNSIDRIILYIDDLDRCEHKTVMKVLKAVHLISSYDMFVVIVGVDHKYLCKVIESEVDKINSKKALALDYLEKIFQIPIIINHMQDDEKIKYIDNLIGKIGTESEEQKKYYESQIKNQKNEDDGIEESTVNDESSELINKEQDKESNGEGVIHPEKYLIKDHENQFVRAIIDIMGKSPRTIKRYFNTYMIIKSGKRKTTEKRERIRNDKLRLLLLALAINNTAENNQFLELIRNCNDEETKFEAFVEENKIEYIKRIMNKEYGDHDAMIKSSKMDEVKERLVEINKYTFSHIRGVE